MSIADGEVWCDVSDDEMYNPGKAKKGTWEPKAEDILKVFEQLKEKKILELHWKCPGRRPPDSDTKEEDEVKEEQTTTPTKVEERKPTVSNEFDFDDDDFGGAKTVLTPRRTPGSAPKSQKKEARMDKILKDMMQQRKLQAAEREARKLAAGNRSPRAPSSPARARMSSPAGSPRTPNRQSPVRLPAGPNDPIGTTPLRVPLDTATSARIPKPPESSVPASSSSQSLESTAVYTGNGQVTASSQPGTVPVLSGAGVQSNTKAGEETLQLSVTKEVISHLSVHQPQQRNTPPEGRGVVPASVKSDQTDTGAEKMDTS